VERSAVRSAEKFAESFSSVKLNGRAVKSEFQRQVTREKKTAEPTTEVSFMTRCGVEEVLLWRAWQ
jgi:hypothetical protein